MVKSGLIHDVTVSHYRLSLHLTTAIIIISIIFWLLKNINGKNYKIFFKLSKNYTAYQILLIIIFFQIIVGAFVSGLDAGQIYQTWPLMGNNYLPNDLIINSLSNVIEFNNHSLVQFYHRNLAYMIILYVFFLSIYIYRNNILTLYKPLKILLIVLLIQASLGIFTLVSGLNIYFASIHQVTSVLLVFSALNLYYLRTK